jgi:predicted N-acetyltransferase YhbS
MNLPERWSISEISEVANLLNRASPEDRFDLQSIREAVADDPDFDPSLLLCVREEGKIVGAIAAEVRRSRREPPDAPVGYVKLLAVTPEWQRRRIGSALLEAVERQFIDAGVTRSRIFADAPTYLRPGVDFRLTAFVCFLLRHGYESSRNAVNMDVDLAKANLDTTVDEARLLRDGIEVRRLAASDTESLSAYLESDWGWSWHSEVARTLGRDPISTHLAWKEGRIVGFSSHNVAGPGQFGPMGVHPDLRRSGIGAVLLRRCLADLHAEGRSHAYIQWVGPIGFYARHVGATLSRCFLQFERELGTT